jgi:plasmid replication initiation protein
MRNTYWEYSIPELRQLFDVGDKYPRFADFNKYVLKPALAEINDYGTVSVKTKNEKLGRNVVKIRFDWQWKKLDDARVTDEENERHGSARHKTGDGTAPPLTDAENERQAKITADRDAWKAWESEHGGTFGQYLDWKKAQV